VYETLREAGIRAEIDEADETLGRRIRAAKLEKLPYFLVIGEKEVSSKTATLESRHEPHRVHGSLAPHVVQGAGSERRSDTLPIPALLERLQTEIRNKKHA